MQDEQIVALYWGRDENAIRVTQEQYGHYLYKIAYNVLTNREDSEESVNDTYWKAWESMPPQKPGILATYLGKITRQLSIDRYRKRNSKKRQGSQYALSLSELDECVSGGNATEQSVDLTLLGEAINAFLDTLSPEARCTFVGRYYYMDSLREVAAYYGMNESKVKNLLYRTRIGLKAHLEQEGFDL